jgi:glutathione S-transferase
MSEPIVLYGDRLLDSPFVFSAFVALREKGLPFELRRLDLDRGEQRAPDYGASSITARVPAIEHGGFWLAESLAIIEYLEESFPPPAHPRLLPDALHARARARQLLGWLRSDLLALRDERPTTTMFFERARTPLSARAQAAADKLLAVAGKVIPEDQDHLFGTFGSADADLAFMLHRLILNGDPVPDRVQRYAERIWQRPSLKAFVEQDRQAAPVPGS